MDTVDFFFAIKPPGFAKVPKRFGEGLHSITGRTARRFPGEYDYSLRAVELADTSQGNCPEGTALLCITQIRRLQTESGMHIIHIPAQFASLFYNYIHEHSQFCRTIPPSTLDRLLSGSFPDEYVHPSSFSCRRNRSSSTVSAMYFLSILAPQYLVFAKSFTTFSHFLYNSAYVSPYFHQFLHFSHTSAGLYPLLHRLFPYCIILHIVIQCTGFGKFAP